MENVAGVKRKSKRRGSRYGKRYELEFKLRCVKLRRKLSGNIGKIKIKIRW